MESDEIAGLLLLLEVKKLPIFFFRNVVVDFRGLKLNLLLEKVLDAECESEVLHIEGRRFLISYKSVFIFLV